MSDSDYTSQFEDAGIGSAVDLLQQSAAAAVKAADRTAILSVPEDDDGRYYLLTTDAPPKLVTPEAPIVRGLLGSIDQVAACAALYGAPLILINQARVEVKFDTRDERPQYAANLERSQQMMLLVKLANNATFRQREFLDLLRVQLAGALDEAGERLIAFVRKFRVDTNDQMTAELKRDRESLGRSVHSEVQSEAGDMPEQITVSVRVFTDRACQWRVPIRCLVDFSTQDHVFRLIPEPESLSDAIDDTLLAIGDRITADVETGYADRESEKPAILFGSF